MDFKFLILFWPLIIGGFVSWFFHKRKISKNLRDFIWLVITAVIFISIARRFQNKMQPDRNDIYGEYTIDTTQFYGKQAIWQYNHYRFEIKEDNKILFHLTEKNKIVKTYTGSVEFAKGYKQPRIILHFEKPAFHILNENPTLYRKMWSFYYVFNSPKFKNVFFKKGNWKPIDE